MSLRKTADKAKQCLPQVMNRESKSKDRSLRQLLHRCHVGAAEGCDLLIFALLPPRLKNHASRRPRRIQPPVHIINPPLGQRRRTPQMHNLAFGSHRSTGAGQRPDITDAQIERRVALAFFQLRVNRAAHARIQQSRRIAAMYAAQRVVMTRIRRALKDKQPGRPFDWNEIHQRANGRRGQFTVADAFKEFGGGERSQMASLFLFTVLKKLRIRTGYRHQSCRNPEPVAALPAVEAEPDATVAVPTAEDVAPADVGPGRTAGSYCPQIADRPAVDGRPAVAWCLACRPRFQWCNA